MFLSTKMHVSVFVLFLISTVILTDTSASAKNVTVLINKRQKNIGDSELNIRADINKEDNLNIGRNRFLKDELKSIHELKNILNGRNISIKRYVNTTTSAANKAEEIARNYDVKTLINSFRRIKNTFRNLTERVSKKTGIFLSQRAANPSPSNDISYLNASQIIKMYDYHVEEHTVITEDGYMLTIQRIPKQNSSSVLLLHGILDSADTWLINSPDPQNCLAFILAEAGYDVWLGNSRGNKYSKRHITLDPSKPEFWKFSFDEIGNYDLPATIDFVLETTNRKDLYFIGHSQGTTSFYAMCSLRPEYNEKIKVMISLAPVAWTTHAFSPLISEVIALPLSTPGVAEEFESVGLYQILPSSVLLTDFVQIFCSIKSIVQPVCTDVVFELFGFSYDELNSTRLPIYLSHTPAGGSIRQISHFCQDKFSRKFRRYDHGRVGNLKVYGSVTPPKYNVTKITAPIALFYATNDYCARPADVQKIVDSFPNIVYEYLVQHESFNHIDFLWALDARTLVYDKVLDVMNLY